MRSAVKRSRTFKFEHIAFGLGTLLLLCSMFLMHKYMDLHHKYRSLADKQREGRESREIARSSVIRPPSACWKTMRIAKHNYTRKSVISEAPGWPELLKKVAGDTGTIVVATGTENYAAALNSFYAISIVQHNIKNFLFVALSNGMCKSGDKPGMLNPAAHCVQYPFMYDDGGMFGTQEFKEVVAVKTDLLLGIVEHNYTALLSDADIVFFVNPLPELRRIRTDKISDLIIQSDSTVGLNSGFMYLPPTQYSHQFLVDVIFGQEKDPVSSQQKIINRLITCFAKHNVQFFHEMLRDEEWPCGRVFHGLNFHPLGKGSRHFAWDPVCPECRIYHNNWVVGEHAKILRFRELLLWADDTQGYFSSATTQYLTVGNPDEGGGGQQKALLVTAMKVAAMLGRVLILPWLRCTQASGQPPRTDSLRPNACSLNEILWLQNWIDAFGEESWRESMFRYNPLTHKDVRLRHNLEHYTRWAHADPRVLPGWLDSSLPSSGLAALQRSSEKAHFIATIAHPSAPPSYDSAFPDQARAEECVVHVPRQLGQMAEDEVRQVLDVPDRVLRLHSLYGVEVSWKDEQEEKKWKKKLSSLDKPQGSAGMEILNHKAKPPKKRWTPEAQE